MDDDNEVRFSTSLLMRHRCIRKDHYYRNNPPAYDYRRVGNDSSYVTSFGKTYIVGEHGFYNETSQWDDFYERLVCRRVLTHFIARG